MEKIDDWKMKIFDVFTVYTCPCFFWLCLRCVELWWFLIQLFNCFSPWLCCFKKDPLHSFLVEVFSSKSVILFTCEEHLLNFVMFDMYYCPHYNRGTNFTARLFDHWFHSRKKCYKCYRVSLKFLKFCPVFYIKNED